MISVRIDRILQFICIIFFNAGFNNVSAQDLFRQSSLTGNWWRLRKQLSEAGLDFDIDYTGESFSNLHGGIKRKTTYLDNFDITMIYNPYKLTGWKGAKIFIYGLAVNGGQPSEFIGCAQTASSIEAYSTVKLYEAWIQQLLLHNKISLLAGIYDLNSEFQVLHSSNLFINSSHGIGIAFSQSGKNGPSIFPNTTFGARIKWNMRRNWYIQSVLLNGVAGNPNNPAGTRFVFEKSNGVLSATEIQYVVKNNLSMSDSTGRDEGNRRRVVKSKHPTKIGFGVWWYSAKFPSILENASGTGKDMETGNAGVYLIGEHRFYNEPSGDGQGLSFFTRIGFANPVINRFVSYSGGGLVYTGLFPGRNGDKLGLALAVAHNGSNYVESEEHKHMPVDKSEWNVEMTYLLMIAGWLNVQPDFQYFINPDTNPSRRNSFTCDLRVSVNF